jgi:aminoglycoside phosphotransferase (APT) family kinase protein
MKPDTVPVRSGEEIDPHALAEYLRGRIAGAEHGVSIEQFPGGHSNLTYLLRAGGHDYVLRRPPLGPVAPKAHDMAREYSVLRALHPLFPLAPEPVLLCEDASVIGAIFFVMERRYGTVLRLEAPGWVDPRRTSEAFIDTLAGLHTVDCSEVLLGRPAGFLERQVSGWAERWHRAKTGDAPKMDVLIRWLVERLPASGPPAVVHNDYKLDNLMLDPHAGGGRVTAVLDWEMTTVGDPLADLGCALCYWPEAGDPPSRRDAISPLTACPGWHTRAQLADRYAARTGRDLSNLHYYEVFGIFKLAVVFQQIYFRYHRGQTRDERFACLGERACGLVETAAQLAEARG